MLVRRVVVHDQVNLFADRDRVVDNAQELQPFLLGVPVLAHGNDLAFQRVEGGEQRSCAVALIVVGHGPRAAFLHWQPRLGAVQRLNLALFVRAQNQGMLGRIQVQAHDGLELFCERRIAAEFEGSHLVRLEPMSAPDAPYTGRGASFSKPAMPPARKRISVSSN